MYGDLGANFVQNVFDQLDFGETIGAGDADGVEFFVVDHLVNVLAAHAQDLADHGCGEQVGVFGEHEFGRVLLGHDETSLVL